MCVCVSHVVYNSGFHSNQRETSCGDDDVRAEEEIEVFKKVFADRRSEVSLLSDLKKKKKKKKKKVKCTVGKSFL